MRQCLNRRHALVPLDPLAVPMSRLLEVAHVAHRLSVSQEFVRRQIRWGKLPAIRLGARWRVDARDLEQYLEAQRSQHDVRAATREAHGR